MDFEKIEVGDILLCKSFSVTGWAIGEAFRAESPIPWHSKHPLRPSGHNGIVGINGYNEPVVYEALFSGFVETPLELYVGRAKAGECEIKFARLSAGITPHEQNQINQWCIEHVGTPYDFASYGSHIWRTALRLPPIWNSSAESAFWCTEAVQKAYRLVGKDVLRKDLPSPYTVEKRVAEWELSIVAEYYKRV